MPTSLSKRIENNVAFVRSVFADCADLTVTPWQFGPEMNHVAVSIFFDTLVPMGRKNVFRQTLQDLVPHQLGAGAGVTADMLKSYLMRHAATEEPYFLIDNADDLVRCLLKGCVAVFLDGWERAVVFRTRGVCSNPASEGLEAQGLRTEAAVTDLRQNIGMIRRRLQHPKFKLVYHAGGGCSRTSMAYGYLDGVVDTYVLAEFEKRIAALSNHDILDTSAVEELIGDFKWKPFPQFRYTERTDEAAAALLDGKIIVLAEGSGSILICPSTFFDLLGAKGNRDRSFRDAAIRWLRLAAFLVALLLPSLYIATVTFHPELVPTALLLALADSREGMPFPAFVEAVIMVFAFELLREAGVRLPLSAGSAVAAAGGIVLGAAVIAAGAASPATVVVMALAGAASFSLPQRNFTAAFRLLQLPLMAMSAWLGGFGLIVGCLLLWIHLVTLNSLGVPFMKPLAPWSAGKLRDVYRKPLKSPGSGSKSPAAPKPQASK
jgi:spore germination protein